MRHADRERSSCLPKPVDMTMVVVKSVPVEVQVLPSLMFMRMNVPSFPVQATRQTEAEPDQHEADD
jgi:hypothetical protein